MLKIEQGYGIDMVELEIPFITFGCLLTDRKGRIEQSTIFEISLIGILHFYDELLAVFSFAIHVEDSLAVGINITDVLRVQIRNVLNNLSAIEQAVEEANEQILVHCCSKNALEAEIGQQADVSFFLPCFIRCLFYILCKDKLNIC